MALVFMVLGVSAAPTRAVSSGTRKFELVSPPDKNGADVVGSPSRTRAAANGDAVQFLSLTGFGDVAGGGIGVDYLSVRDGKRGTHGWSTHAITPGHLEPLSFIEAFAGVDPRYVGELDPSLNTGVFLSHVPLTAGAENTNGVLNLYLRTDVRQSGPGTFTLLTGCPGCATPFVTNHEFVSQPALAGTSADFRHVIFESRRGLTADVPACDPGLQGAGCPLHLYEWSDGIVRLAGVLPETEGGGPAPNSQAGQGATTNAQYTPNTISQDGRRIFFTVQDGGAASEGQLYMRVDNTVQAATTVRLNESERTNPDPTSLDARYWGATPDGSKIFFTTKENLIDTDNSDENLTDLYEYSVNAPAGQHLRLISTDSEPNDGTGADVQGIIGASDDGSYVYFIAQGQLVRGMPVSAGNRIFVSHDGVIKQVGKVDPISVSLLVSDAGWRLSPKNSRVTPDGQRMVFVSEGTDELPHTGGEDHCGANQDAPCREVFVYDASFDNGAGRVACASCLHPDGAARADATFLFTIGNSAAGVTSHQNHPISADGRLVFFDSADRLVAADENGTTPDVYEYQVENDRTELISSGKTGSFGSHFVDASADGANVFFVTRDKLVGWDVDDNVDLYDARVGGGFPEPVSGPAECSGDACQGVRQSGPQGGPVSSASVVGRGNLHNRRSLHRRTCHKKGHGHRRGRPVFCAHHRRHRKLLKTANARPRETE